MIKRTLLIALCLISCGKKCEDREKKPVSFTSPDEKKVVEQFPDSRCYVYKQEETTIEDKDESPFVAKCGEEEEVPVLIRKRYSQNCTHYTFEDQGRTFSFLDCNPSSLKSRVFIGESF